MPELLEQPSAARGRARRPPRAEARAAERLLFRLAMAAIAAHALDYAFLNREPGTAPGDHLPSALVPTALAIALAWVYPRARPGARASIALASGALALTAGFGVSVRHVVLEGFGRDDGTGLLVAVSGVVLVALGAATLWRTRRLDERRARRYVRRLLVAVVAVLVAYEAVLPIGLAVVITHRARWSVPAADLGRPYQHMTLTAADGIRLAGWYVPSRNRAAVIVSPGRGSGPVARARMLVRHGYGVLLFDRRGEVAGEGDFNILGWSGERDLRAAVAYLGARPDVDPRRIGGLGLSVGGEMLLQAAAHDERIRAVASEGAGARSVAEGVHLSGIAKWQTLPYSAVLTAATAVLANDFPPPDLATLVGRISPRPVFLIYAPEGELTERLNPLYYARAGAPKVLWSVPGGGHTGALSAYPREYERRVVGFLDRSLLGRG